MFGRKQRRIEELEESLAVERRSNEGFRDGLLREATRRRDDQIEGEANARMLIEALGIITKYLETGEAFDLRKYVEQTRPDRVTF